MTTRWEMTLELRRRFALERLGDDAGLVKSGGKPPHSKGSGRRVLGVRVLRHDTALVQAIGLKKRGATDWRVARKTQSRVRNAARGPLPAPSSRASRASLLLSLALIVFRA
jgi:hypothetical protein